MGTSDRPAGGRPRDGGAAGLQDAAGALPADYRAFGKLRPRFVSRGHVFDRWEVDLYANEAAREAIRTRSRAVPPGAIVVAEHFERSEGRPPGPILVMEKKAPGFAKEHGDFRWAIIGSQGQLVQDGVIESCAGCHDDSPMDGFFPLPADGGL